MKENPIVSLHNDSHSSNTKFDIAISDMLKIKQQTAETGNYLQDANCALLFFLCDIMDAFQEKFLDNLNEDVEDKLEFEFRCELLEAGSMSTLGQDINRFERL